MKKFIINNIKMIIAFILGIIISGTGVYAATIIFQGDQVGFDNTNAGIILNNQSVDNVQDAIDAIYTKVTGIQTQLNTCTGDLSTAQSNYSTCSSSLSTCQSNLTIAQANEFLTKYKTMSGTPQYYAWNETPESSTSKGSHNVYLAKWNDGQFGVCINSSETQYCFRYGNYFGEKEHVQEVFGTSNCDVGSPYVNCRAFGFYCTVLSSGSVSCRDISANEYCHAYSDGSLECYKL